MYDRYQGTGGYEGHAGLRGQAKPLLLGHCKNIAPARIDQDRIVYQVSGEEVAHIYNLRDGWGPMSELFGFSDDLFSLQCDDFFDERVIEGADGFVIDLHHASFRCSFPRAGRVICDVIAEPYMLE